MTVLLKQAGLIGAEKPRFSPLTGGVSSDIWLAESGGRQWVIKQALDTLKVRDHWEADTARNLTEQAFISFVQPFRPDAVPRILASDSGIPCFVMEYLGPPFVNWKSQLMAGIFDAQTTRQAAELLAEIHRRSRGDAQLAEQFDTTASFFQLRIEPYLLTTGQRHPALRAHFEAEAKRIQGHREALVHGDFSPKNMLISPERLVLLDHEVAWYGDPAFDLAFFLNHLFLKTLLHARELNKRPDLPLVAWQAYFEVAGGEQAAEMAKRSARLLLLLLLARIDGKSPVEYLGQKEQAFVRQFVYTQLAESREINFPDLHQQWKQQVSIAASGF